MSTADHACHQDRLSIVGNLFVARAGLDPLRDGVHICAQIVDASGVARRLDRRFIRMPCSDFGKFRFGRGLLAKRFHVFIGFQCRDLLHIQPCMMALGSSENGRPRYPYGENIE